MSLTRIQRDAMARAQNGDWELADAIEVVARAAGTPTDWPLIGGIRQGGRLQFLAYGSCGCTDECSADCDGGDYCDGANHEEIKLVTNLNGDVLWCDDAPDSDGDPPPPFDWVDLSLHGAQAAVAAYHAAVVRPTQNTLIPEPA